jgi:serine/threonine-protein kinase HipA
MIKLGDLLNASEALDEDTATAEDLMLLLRGGSSLGGARPKAHVLDNFGRVAIAKFPSAKTDDWDVGRWEEVALTLSESAGIRTAEHDLHVVENKAVLVVRRFDRRPQQQRIGYVSAMTLLSADDGAGSDYLDIASQIEVESEDPTQDLRELWARCVFGRMISNTDDHLRNHGFLRGASGWRLSPAFDMNPNLERGTFSTGIDGNHGDGLLALIVNAAYFRMDPDDVASKLKQIAAATAGWERVATATGISDAEINRMHRAFENQATQDASDHLGKSVSP